MTIKNAGNSRWTIIAETTPSGVTSVTHTGMEDYDWIVCEFLEVESSASSLIYLEVGYGATPTYMNHSYIRLTSAQSQFTQTGLYPTGTNLTVDRRGSWFFANPGKRYTGAAEPMNNPVSGFGYSTTAAQNGMMLGNGVFFKVPITACRYSSSAGNLQGTGAIIRTWGYR